MTENIKSSYNDKVLTFGDVIQLLTWTKKPEKIVEFGILNGYSLINFSKGFPNAKIEGYDIFENFNGNSAKRDIIEKISNYNNIVIKEGDYYKKYLEFEDKSIDILHIDIANDGSTYEFAFNNYMPKIKNNGLLIMEGGSKERDEVYWMTKYNKIPINNILEKYKDIYDIYTIKIFPSLTIVHKI